MKNENKNNLINKNNIMLTIILFFINLAISIFLITITIIKGDFWWMIIFNIALLMLLSLSNLWILLKLFNRNINLKIIKLISKYQDKQYLIFRVATLINLLVYGVLFIVEIYTKLQFTFLAWKTSPIIPLMFYAMFISYIFYTVITIDNYKKYIFNSFNDQNQTTIVSKGYLFLRVPHLRQRYLISLSLIFFNIGLLLILIMTLLYRSEIAKELMILYAMFFILSISIMTYNGYTGYVSYQKYKFFNSLMRQSNTEFTLKSKDLELIDVKNDDVLKWINFKHYLNIVFVLLLLFLGVVVSIWLKTSLGSYADLKGLFALFLLIPTLSLLFFGLFLWSKIKQDKYVKKVIENDSLNIIQ
ncbi:hypothetical protein GE118_02205 [Mycoplasma sp. NEAQ87857]|uniref:hypothetical protein n=1 Tax=Mycoplasma sp. NEAQ87857 TaxID=2683967 RepID=UPI001316C56B|nr:hypothetical protein [Mycoplasma sp. NEAQ87857]QGZ97608.1 hypothetical protein GE118_02205 [Mycoplasma sp. NEAQ87857]